MKQRKIVHFGAGNIGRGLIGELFFKNNFEIVFVDTNKELVELINTKNKYTILFDNNSSLEVKNVRALWTEDQTLIAEIKTADIISTSIGAVNLKHLKPLLAPLLKNTTKPQTVICFENGVRVSGQFKTQFEQLDSKVNFVDVVVDRIVPKNPPELVPDVQVESYFEVECEQNQLQQFGKLWGICEVKNLDAYIARKLLLLNGIHSAIGFLGLTQKIASVRRAWMQPEIQQFMDRLIELTIEALLKQFSEFSKVELELYVDRVIERITNEKLRDQNARVTRNALAKLQKNERFGQLYQLLLQHNLPTKTVDYLFALILFQNKLVENPDAQQLAQLLTLPLQNAQKILTEYKLLQANPPKQLPTVSSDPWADS